MTKATTFDLMRLCVGILRSAGTDVGDRVYTPSSWPTTDAQTPFIRARVQAEDKQSLGRSAAQFIVTGTIKFTITVGQPASADDQGADAADTAAWAIVDQIETALINNPLLYANIQQVPFTHARDAYDAGGARLYGQIEYLLGVEFYQGAADFFPIATVPLERITLDLDLINIFDADGTYAAPPFPDSVKPAPRAEGPDGRAEGRLDVTLPQ